MTPNSFEISRLLENEKLSAFQKLIVGLCAITALLEGFDAQAIGYVAPALLEQGVLTGAQLGPLFSASLFGLMVGALFIAPLADRMGRRPVLLASTVVFGGFSLATAWATDFNDLACLRFLTGIGLGGGMPNAIALTAEYSPTARRGFLVSIMFSGFTFGSLVGGIISAGLVPLYGWRWVFVFGGVLPLALAPILYCFMPESLRYLLSRQNGAERAVKVIRRAFPEFSGDADTHLIIDEAIAAKSSVRQLLTQGRAARTILLWIIFFLSLLDIYMLVNWLPTIVKASGASMLTAILIGTTLQAGGLIGAFPLGYLLDRTGPAASIGLSYLLGAISIALIGVFVSSSIPVTALVVFLAGFGILGGQGVANATASISYSTEIRSTGVGWALGIGRVGSIIGPLVGGALQSMNTPPGEIFLMSAVPAFGVVLASIALHRISRLHSPGG